MSDDSAWRPPSAVTTATDELAGYADLEEVGHRGDPVLADVGIARLVDAEHTASA